MQKPRLTIVVPCYNEEPVLPKSAAVLGQILTKLIDEQQILADSKILFVDDGSQDKTWAIISSLERRDSHYAGLRFSRNFGHQNALMAGMSVAEKVSDAVITIDADLQDDPNLIPEMVAKYLAGAMIVLGVRNDRSSDSRFKRVTAESFYAGMRWIGVQLVPDHADFRLLGKPALHELMKYRETDPFLRGIIPQLGFPTEKLFYQRRPRFAGESKYPFKKMLHFAIDGITSFSIAPIKAILVLGIGVIGIGLIMLMYVFGRFLLGDVVTGWTSLMTSLWFLGGAQLVGISVVGEYVGKIFTETKHRPRYIIQEDDYSNSFPNAKLNGATVKLVSRHAH